MIPKDENEAAGDDNYEVDKGHEQVAAQTEPFAAVLQVFERTLRDAADGERGRERADAARLRGVNAERRKILADERVQCSAADILDDCGQEYDGQNDAEPHRSAHGGLLERSDEHFGDEENG